jgi:hypothetical protein
MELSRKHGNYDRSSTASITPHYQRHTLIVMLAGTMWVLSFVVYCVPGFVTGDYANGQAYSTTEQSGHQLLNGQLTLIEAVLQTIGAMVVAASDVDVDLFAKRHPRCILTFALSWIVIYEGLYALAPPIQLISQVWWIATLPFVYLLLRFRAVLRMDREYPRFSDLLVYGLSLNLVCYGAYWFLQERISGRLGDNYIGVFYILGGAILVGLYWHYCRNNSRRLALSITLYTYLLEYGFLYLAEQLVAQYAYHVPLTAINYSFAIIHITFPIVYFLFSPVIYPWLARRWLNSRSESAWSIANEQGISPEHGNLAVVEQAIRAGADLNAHIQHGQNTADKFTLLILACFNQHEDAVDLLLTHGVLVNKGSLHQNWMPLYVAAMKGNSLIVEKLIAHGANVHAKTEDELTALLAATMYGHSQIIQQLMEAGARKKSTWMGISVMEAATTLRQASSLRVLTAYESHFQGHIPEVHGGTCVASWPGIYAKQWDKRIAGSSACELSAAVVFLPEHTMLYGKHGSDKCYCKEMYGHVRPWGCRWFELVSVWESSPSYARKASSPFN